MRIVVNTRLLLKDKLEGIGRFSYETLKIITRKHPEHHFVFLFDRDYDEAFIFSDNITPVVLFPQARHPFLFYWWFEYSVGRLLNKMKPDLFLSPDGYLSLSSDVKQLPVIHDLSFVHYPNDVPFLVRKYYNHFFPRFAHKAVRIATVSEFSKTDIVKQYGISPELIDVVYNGVNEIFLPASPNEVAITRKKYTGGESYFLFVGSLHPRKNIVRLLKAYDLFADVSMEPVKLLIVGERYWWNSDMETTFRSMKHQDNIVFTGRLDDEELRCVLGAALALTYVPYFEGFGIPILEGFKSGIPVITSNVTSMPEVAGKAALMINPFSVDSIKEGMIQMTSDSDLRASLVRSGAERLSLFSWEKTADKLWDSIEKAIHA